MRAAPRDSRVAIGLGVASTLLGLVVVAAAVLRETPQFWQNGGGSSAELRALVRFFFYPSLVLYLACVLAGIGTSLKSRTSRQQRGRVLIFLSALHVFLLLTAAVIAFRNNVGNVLKGAPLHQHP